MHNANEQMATRGTFTLEARDASGRVRERRHYHNKITNAGLAWLAGALSGDVADPTLLKYIGIGTGTTPATATDTALETPVESRAQGTTSRVTTTVTNDTYQVQAAITLTGARAITEAGLFSAASGGTMASRQVFPVINLTTDETITVTWTYQMTEKVIP